MRFFRSFCLFLLLGAVSLFAAEWKNVLYCRKPEGNLVLPIENCGPEGVMVALRCRESGRVVRLTMGRNNQAQEVFSDGRLLSLPMHPEKFSIVAPGAGSRVLLKIRTWDWSWYVDGVLCGRMPAPFGGHVELLWPDRSRARLAAPPSFLPVPKASYQTDFMVEPGAPAALYPWRIRRGAWHLHTARAQSEIRPETNQQRTREAPPVAEKSPNFYSLAGGSKNEDSVITIGYEFYDHYCYSAAFQLQEGEAGLLFCYRDGKSAEEDSFYGLTLKMVGSEQKIMLWRQVEGRRTMLVSRKASLYRNQWYRPEVRLTDGEIVCLLDGVEVFRTAERLPAGGMAGLYAKTPEFTRFDDVKLSPNEIWQEARKTSALPEAILPQVALGKDRFQRYGRDFMQGAVFSAELEAPTAEVLFGWQGEGMNAWSVRKEGEASVLFEIASDGRRKVLDRFPVGKDAKRIMIDGTVPGEWRVLWEGRLVHWFKGNAAGAYGTLGAVTKVDLRSSRIRYEEQPQKNPIFQKDSFMRHWSSPEGKWIGCEEKGVLWNKGDFFGDFDLILSIVDKGEIHLAVPEGKKAGRFIIAVSRKALNFEKKTIPVPPKVKSLRIHQEGYWLVMYLDGRECFRERRRKMLSQDGMRVFTRGYSLNDMKLSKVTRQNVICDFFNESPYSWMAIGGDWQIINRFQCTPSWSHMICQTLGGYGSFWRKQRFSGNLTLEFYAGTRHEYYHLGGNMNCTIMAEKTSPSSGYTFTNTEYDQDLSQIWNRLYKNGVSVRENNLYCIPRNRRGLVRRILNPLISQGRPFHGAWFYIKVRKIGDKLEYYFDDELVYTERDPEMIQQGLVGIWTFVHSMTLAQIQITFDRCENVLLNTELGPIERGEAPSASKPARKKQRAPQKWEAAANGFPLDALNARFWKMENGDIPAELTSISRDADALQWRNRLGGGAVTARAMLPPMPLEKVAGFRFRVRRHGDARFNFFYEFGRVDKGKFVPLLSYYHQLCGLDFERGGWQKAGETPLQSGQWCEVTAWLPVVFPNGKRVATHVRVGGFGIQELDFLQSGIGGNSPGSGYDIEQFRPVFRGAPKLTLDAGASGTASSERGEVRTGRTEEAEELSKQLAACGGGGEQHCGWLRLRKRPWSLITPVDWVTSGKEETPHLTWSKTEADTIIISMKNPVPDKWLQEMNFSVNEETQKMEFQKDGSAIVHLDGYIVSSSAWLKVVLVSRDGRRMMQFFLPRIASAEEKKMADHGRRINGAPRLYHLDGVPVAEFFEQSTGILQNNGLSRIIWEEGEGHLRVQNQRRGQRLKTIFQETDRQKKPWNLARYPVFSYRYRAENMSAVSFWVLWGYNVRLSMEDADGRSIKVRRGEEWKRDDKWHLWTGMISDCFWAEALSTHFHSTRKFQWHSGSRQDQTGRYSRMELDDILVGPAIRSAEELKLTPFYRDLDGVQRVEWRLDTGKAWHVVENGKPFTPVFPAGIAEGMHLLHLRATDTLGAVSRETTVPFLLDRRPPNVRQVRNGQQWELFFDGGEGAPVDVAFMAFRVGGRRIADCWYQGGFAPLPQESRLVVDLAYACRSALDVSKDHQTITATLKNVRDGAGNTAPDQTLIFQTDYAADHKPPEWHTCQVKGPGVSYSTAGNGTQYFRFGFYNSGNSRGEMGRDESGNGFHKNIAGQGHAELGTGCRLQLKDTPYLAFRLASPHYRKKWRLFLQISLSNGRTFEYNLLAPGKGAAELNLTERYNWAEKEKDVWHEYILDLRTLLEQKGISRKEQEKLQVTNFSFIRHGQKAGEQLWLDDCYCFGTMQEKTCLHWLAFDMSGIRELRVKDGGQEMVYPVGKKVSLQPYAGKGPRWLQVRAVDRAGNQTKPVFVPVW